MASRTTPDTTVPTSDKSGGPMGRDEFAELVERCDGLVFNTIFRIVKNREDAEDVAQEAWLRAAKSLPSLRDRTYIDSWLYRISRNCALNFLAVKKNRRQASIDGDAAGEARRLASPRIDEPEERMVSVVRREQVVEALMAIPEDEREVLVLREFHGLPYADIGQMLHISSGNAAVRSWRARARFRERWASFRGVAAAPFAVAAAKLRGLGEALTSSIPRASEVAGTAANWNIATSLVSRVASGPGLEVVASLIIAGTSAAVVVGAVAHDSATGSPLPTAATSSISAEAAGTSVTTGASQPVPTATTVTSSLPGIVSEPAVGPIDASAAIPETVVRPAYPTESGQASGNGVGPGNGQAQGNGISPGGGPASGDGTGPGNGQAQGQGNGNNPGSRPASANGLGPGNGQGQGQGNGNSSQSGPASGNGLGPGNGQGQGEGIENNPGNGSVSRNGLGPGNGQGQGEGIENNPGDGAVGRNGLGPGNGQGQGEGIENNPGDGAVGRNGLGPGNGQAQGNGIENNPGDGPVGRNGLGPGNGQGQGDGSENNPGDGPVSRNGLGPENDQVEGQGNATGPTDGQGSGAPQGAVSAPENGNANGQDPAGGGGQPGAQAPGPGGAPGNSEPSITLPSQPLSVPGPVPAHGASDGRKR